MSEGVGGLIERLGARRGRLALALLGAWLVTGGYLVGPDQRAVVRLCGRALEPVEPGVWWRPPWPLSVVDRVRVHETRQVGIGVSAAGRLTGQGTPAEQMITGDHNLVELGATVQYAVRDPRRYLFAAVDVDRVVAGVAHVLLTESIAAEPVDYLMTTGRDEVRQRVLTSAQELLDEYGAGVVLRDVSLVQVSPPQPVAAAFNDVINAAQDRDRLVNEARGYANEQVPAARGQAAETAEQAAAYRARVVNEATGGAARFRQVSTAYRAAPQVSRIRLHLETIEKIAPNLRTTIVDANGGQRPIDLGIIGLGRPAP